MKETLKIIGLYFMAFFTGFGIMHAYDKVTQSERTVDELCQKRGESIFKLGYILAVRSTCEELGKLVEEGCTDEDITVGDIFDRTYPKDSTEYCNRFINK